MRVLSSAAGIALWLAAAAASGQASHCDMGGSDYADPAFLEKPTVLQEGIGKISQKVTTRFLEAQAFYDQGLAYIESYVFLEAARSFHQALRIDPDCSDAILILGRRSQTAEEAVQFFRRAIAAARRQDVLKVRPWK